MESRHLQYIGKKAEKPDNICNTGLMWHGTGDVKEVPSVVAERLLQHTDIWRDVTEEVESGKGAPSLGGTVDNPHLPDSTVQFTGGREEQILKALHVMDESNPEHYKDGYPSIAVVEGILSYEITPDELRLVVEDMQSAQNHAMGISDGDT
jgi:hypothetical protein